MRTGPAPQALAATRSAVAYLRGGVKAASQAAATRAFAARPAKALPSC